MKRISILLATTAIFFVITGSQAFARTDIQDIQESFQRRNELCFNETGRDKLRRQSRMKRRLQESQLYKTISTEKIQSRMNLKRVQVRLREREQRTERNNELLKSRRTYREKDLGNDINTSRVEYLQEYRESQRACMLGPSGRIRTLCIENSRTNVRKKMRANRGVLMRYR